MSKLQFNSIGIDVDDANFGIWVESHEHLTNAYSYNKMRDDETAILSNLNKSDLDKEFLRFLRNIHRLW